MQILWSFAPFALVATGCSAQHPDFVEPGQVGSGETEGSTAGTWADDGGTGVTSSTEQGDGDGDGDCADDWWDTDWSHRRRVDLDNTSQSDLTDLPVRVRLPADFDYANAEADGIDLRFVGASGTTVLEHYAQTWSPGDESNLWVRVPSLSSGEDHVWLYYGSPGAPDVQDAAATYDDQFSAVVHLDEGSGMHQEMTAGFTCAWEGGAGDQGASGYIAGSNELDGKDNGVNCGVDRIPDAQELTVTAWVNLPLIGNMQQTIVNVESFEDPYPGIGLYVRASDGAVGEWVAGKYHFGEDAGSRVSPDEWAFIAQRTFRSTMDDGWVRVSVNGGPWEEVFVGNTASQSIENGTAFCIGKWGGPDDDEATTGRIDEVAISGVDRGEDWVHGYYLSSSARLASLGRIQTCP